MQSQAMDFKNNIELAERPAEISSSSMICDCNSAVVSAILNPQPELKGILCGIYKITSPTGCIYIGRSKNILSRWRYYKRLKFKGQFRIYNSIKKHRWENHKKEIVVLCDESKLSELEIYYIKLFNCFNTPYGMNLTSGGDCPIFSQEAIERFSESHKGIPTWNKGLKNIYSEETLYEMGKGRRGKPGTFAGHTHTDSSCKQMGEKRIGNKNNLGKKRPLSGAKISEKLKGRPALNRKKIMQFDLNGNFIKLWDSVAMVDNSFRDGSRTIANCMQRKSKISRGFKWQYLTQQTINKLPKAA
ncbi:MAG: GIY-YIG nuclease family protein [Nanoarchaeota archaeon]